MDYEKKYKEALERMKSWARGEHPECFAEAQKAAEFIFPELAESEDEKIRKAIICGMNAFKDQKKETFAFIPIDDCIAWLEKQGKQIPADKVESKDYSSIDPHFGKPIDKQKPKFHEGDWVILFEHNDSIYQVERIDNYRYYLRHYSGYTISPHFDRETIRLWTIKDAKDGDVLYSPTHHLIWVYKDKDKYHAATNLNYVDSISFDGDIFIPSDVCPANREQRSILFQKMKEAGYMWDGEKKELKKIENKI